MPLYLPGYYYKNQTQMAEHYNVSIQRQLDKSTVVTVAYVGTEGHHIEHGEDIIWGDAALCQSIPGCGRVVKPAFTRRVAKTTTVTLPGRSTIRPSARATRMALRSSGGVRFGD